MPDSSDPLLAQYRTVASGELAVVDGALSCGVGPADLGMVREALQRIIDMAALLRHRRTVALVSDFVEALELKVVEHDLVVETLSAIDRCVHGGRPDPAVHRRLSALLDEEDPVISTC